jgi:hypothetical protein
MAYNLHHSQLSLSHKRYLNNKTQTASPSMPKRTTSLKNINKHPSTCSKIHRSLTAKVHQTLGYLSQHLQTSKFLLSQHYQQILETRLSQGLCNQCNLKAKDHKIIADFQISQTQYLNQLVPSLQLTLHLLTKQTHIHHRPCRAHNKANHSTRLCKFPIKSSTNSPHLKGISHNSPCNTLNLNFNHHSRLLLEMDLKVRISIARNLGQLLRHLHS